MINTTTKIEGVVKEKFPEVQKIVSRIGVAEVPTDPMPMDLADIFVILAPQEEWVTTDSKEELVENVLKSKAQIIVMIGAGDIGELVDVIKNNLNVEN